jgi:hypothetical protein
MRQLLILAAAATVGLASTAMAQAQLPEPRQAPATAERASPEPSPRSTRSPGPTTDRGPKAPNVDAAHRGGGVVLEGALGAPAPPPMPTPPRSAPSR